MSAGQQRVAAKHTPGPWIVVDGHWLKPAGKTRIVGTILDFDGCMVYRDGYTPEEMDAECEANKRVIVAAPELLAELQAAHQIIRNALAVMTTAQKLEWGNRNAADGVDGEGITRAHEREAVIAKATVSA